MVKLKCVSLFCGIGGFDIALTNLGHEIVYVNDWDLYASETYEKNFGYKPDTRDIKTVDSAHIPKHDLLVAGFPCQSFSIAGKRGGFEDTRGTMFFEVARIIKDKRPSYLLLENVKGLLSHDNGRTFETIMRSLDELGYDCEWQILNSKNFGVPQNRERVFIVGYLRGKSKPKIFPISRSNREDILEKGEASEPGERVRGSYISSTVDANYHKGSGSTRQFIAHNVYGGFGEEKIREFHDYSPTIRTPKGGGHIPLVVALTETRTEEAKRIRSENLKNGKDWSPRRSKKLVPRNDDKANTITAGQSKEHLLLDGMKVRKLTPIECERLQGFPDGYTAGVSDTQRYRQLGNAVTVPVVEEILKRL